MQWVCALLHANFKFFTQDLFSYNMDSYLRSVLETEYLQNKLHGVKITQTIKELVSMHFYTSYS